MPIVNLLTLRASGDRRAAIGLSLSLFLLTAIAPLRVRAADEEPPKAETPDAVIEEWHQRWTLNPDGGVIYHEQKRVKLNNDRAYGNFTDPRITFDKNTDAVEVIVARVKTPRGQVIETPAYSKNEVSPGGAAGWPAFATLRQLVLTLSGIEPGCVTELEFRITTRPRPGAVVAADLRLDQEYPVTLRTVTVDVPIEAPFSPLVTGLAESAYTYSATSGSAAGRGTLSHRWEFVGLAPTKDEPQSPPWQTRSPRLCFTTADPGSWVGEQLDSLSAAAEATPPLRDQARKWTADAAGDDAKLAALQRGFAETFNFVHFDSAWRKEPPRAIAEIFGGSYGTPEEAIVLWLALLRAADVECRAGMLVSDDAWCPTVPQTGNVAAYVAVVTTIGGMQVWHPQHGRIQRNARWLGHSLQFRHADDEDVSSIPLARFDAAAASELRVTAKIKLAGDGSYAGSAAVSMGGLFIPDGADGDDGQQQECVRNCLSRLLPNVHVESVKLRSLSPATLSDGGPDRLAWSEGVFRGDAIIKSAAPLEKIADRFALMFAADGPHTATIAWPPLARTRRQTPVRLSGPFVETIELIVEWPDGWKVEARPDERLETAGEFGRIEQRVTIDGSRLTLRRNVLIEAAEQSPAAFAAVRDALNQLRSESQRTVLLKP